MLYSQKQGSFLKIYYILYYWIKRRVAVRPLNIVVYRRIELLLQEWKSCVLTIRRIDHELQRMDLHHRSCGYEPHELTTSPLCDNCWNWWIWTTEVTSSNRLFTTIPNCPHLVFTSSPMESSNVMLNSIDFFAFPPRLELGTKD